MQQRKIEERLGNVELLLDEDDCAAKETEVRYTHKEIFLRVRNRTDEMKIFKELDKGIDDMEAGRVIEHNEAMRILENRFKL